MVHFDKSSYKKFNCPRCLRNYSNYDELKMHGFRDKCNFESKYPPQRFFVDKALLESGMVRGKFCTGCNKNFEFVYMFDEHLISCLRLHFPCYKCSAKFAQYKPARIHNERCDGTGIGANKNIFYGDDKVDLPAQELKSKTWTEEEMMEVIRKVVVPKLNWLFSMYEEGALGLIGMTKRMSKRMADYNLSWQVYGRDETTKYLELQDCVLFSCWNRYTALQFEYLCQRHTILKGGDFFDIFGTRMNQQAVCKPSIFPGSLDEQAHYVYFRATRKPFKLSDIKKGLEPSDYPENEPSTSA